MSKYPFLPSGETDEIGSATEPWKNVYGENFHGNLEGEAKEAAALVIKNGKLCCRYIKKG